MGGRRRRSDIRHTASKGNLVVIGLLGKTIRTFTAPCCNINMLFSLHFFSTMYVVPHMNLRPEPKR